MTSLTSKCWCDTLSHSHNEAAHNRPVDTHCREEVTRVAALPKFDRSSWSEGEPNNETATLLYENCVDAFQATIFLKGLPDAYKEYNDRLKNAYTEGTDIYSKAPAIAKERVVSMLPPHCPCPHQQRLHRGPNRPCLYHDIQGRAAWAQPARDTPYYNADRTFNCSICKQKGHKAN